MSRGINERRCSGARPVAEPLPVMDGVLNTSVTRALSNLEVLPASKRLEEWVLPPSAPIAGGHSPLRGAHFSVLLTGPDADLRWADACTADIGEWPECCCGGSTHGRQPGARTSEPTPGDRCASHGSEPDGQAQVPLGLCFLSDPKASRGILFGRPCLV